MIRMRSSRSTLRWTVAATAAAGLVAGLATAGGAQAAPAAKKLAPGAAVSSLPKTAKPGKARPQGLPRSGKFAFLLELDARSTSSVYSTTRRSAGTASAKRAARSQLGTVRAAQNRVIGNLPRNSSVLYRSHAALAGVAVVTDVKNYDTLRHLAGVADVYPIAPKKIDNSYAVPYQQGAAAWSAYGDLGQNSTIAIIDTGSDYTHANLGGPGTVAAYNAAKAADTALPDPSTYSSAKFNFTTTDLNGDPAYMYDFAGDTYNADPTSDSYQPVPHPDPNPLDCNSHGSHVAGTAAGFGENADGTTYTGAYDESTPFDSMRIGPGVAPKARIYSYKVFGCDGSTDVTGEAIDKAMDPNGDGDTSDHADVINMSLGSDYGFPDDGDSVLVNQASQVAGVTVVVASGNGGDIYDIGGSPGNAVRSIAVANSQDASSRVDALHVTIDGAAHDYAAERSVAYDWVNGDDLSGPVVRVTQPGNLDGCDPLDADATSAVAGKVAFVEWDNNDATRRCGSATRAGNLATAGASGFVFGSNQEEFTAGITGSADIPGVLVAKSGADAMRTALEADQAVDVTGTTLGGTDLLDTGLNDTVNDSSSRGIRDAGNVKPDVTAIGTSVWSTGMGTGNEGLNDTGTSMATPMVAGTAALVTSHHPDWTPEQVKADIMNTADADLYLGTNHTGAKYAPNRVGAGRIDIKAALDNSVLAYTTDGPNGTSTGNVSASWGPLALPVGGGTWTGSKTIKLQNTGLDAVSYAVGFDDRTTIPGAAYSVSPSTVTVQPRQTATVTLTLTIDPTQLTKTIDPTVDRLNAGLPRQYLADASGLVTFTDQDPDGTDLRVPAYAAPRPASDMTQPGSLTLPDGAVQKALLPLTGDQVHSGSGATAIQSLVAGFELQATSGQAPQCTDTVTTGCWDIPDERAADLRYVGTTSDAPQWDAIGGNPLVNGEAYFALSTWGTFRHPVSPQEYDVYIDSDGDGVADVALYTTRVATTVDTDVPVTALVDLTTGHSTVEDAVNGALGDTDTAAFDSDSLVLPVPIADLPGVTAQNSRINYAVFAFDGYHSAPVDQVGDVDENNKIVGGLSTDVLHPGLTVAGSFNGESSPLLFDDSPGSVLAVRRDAAAYRADAGRGALMVHFHNAVGEKAQVVDLNQQATVTLGLAPNPVKAGQTVTATIGVSGSAGAPTGTVTLKRVGGSPATVGTASLTNGTAKVTFPASTVGSAQYQATYAGDGQYAAGQSAPADLTVTKAAPAVSLTITPSPAVHGKPVKFTVKVSGPAGTPTGTVTVRRLAGAKYGAGTVGTGSLSGGTATVQYKPGATGTFQYQVTYGGNGTYLSGTSAKVQLKIT
jgi:subtilisin family serine protease